MTKQEYYNLLFCSALDGTFPSVDKFGTCRYRIQDRKCAVGILLSDDKYDLEFEGKNVTDPDIRMVFNCPIGTCIYDMAECQKVHDKYSLDINFKECFLENLNRLPCFVDVMKLKAVSEKSTKPSNVHNV